METSHDACCCGGAQIPVSIAASSMSHFHRNSCSNSSGPSMVSEWVLPKNVLESSERLRRELHPERGWVDWRPVQARRKQAEARIQAVEEYARVRVPAGSAGRLFRRKPAELSGL